MQVVPDSGGASVIPSGRYGGVLGRGFETEISVACWPFI